MILHVDMDAFYASVEERDRPELRGRPVVVGGSAKHRGVVSAANYVVRQFGVHSAMPMATALRLCSHAVVLPVRMEHYAAISRQIREVFHRYTPLVEPLSLDEAFLDVTGSESLFGAAKGIARQIKHEILVETRLVASVGVAPNKFLAKVASDLDKPDGLVIVDPNHVQEFLDPLPISRLWGVGKVSQHSLHQLGIHTVGQLRQMSAESLRRRFGRGGQHLWELAHGRDDRAVVPDREAKSISHETTFVVDIHDRDVLRAWLAELTEQVARRLRRHHLRAKTVQLKVRFSDFATITRSHSVKEPTDVTDELWKVATELFAKVSQDRGPIRLIGVGVSGIDQSGLRQRDLFDDERHEQNSRLDAATDAIRDRFGGTAVRRGINIRRDPPDES
jgi:DNA polymerase-4